MPNRTQKRKMSNQNLRRLFLISLKICISTIYFTKAQTVDFSQNGLEAVGLNANSQFTLLNARGGSRFSFSFVAKENGYHIGAVGMDNDAAQQVLIGVGEGSGNYIFRGAGLPNGFEYLKNQKLHFGLSGHTLIGQTPKGLMVKAHLYAPFNPFDSLNETDKLKLFSAPIWYQEVEVTNNGNKPAIIPISIGMRSIPYDENKEMNFSYWRIGKPCKQLYYREGVQAERNFIGLSSLQTTNTTHFTLDGYHGLRDTISLKPKQSAKVVYLWSAHYKGKVLEDVKHNHILRFAYNRWFSDIKAVIQFGKKNLGNAQAAVVGLEKLLTQPSLQPSEKWMLALVFHSDWANGLLLETPNGQIAWYQTEGRFRHMNTIDVALETELIAPLYPWRLKLLLEQWSKHLAIHEQMVPSGRSAEFIKENIEGVSASELGPYLYHDVGNMPYLFGAEGYDFGPFMPVEENTNFVILLNWYRVLTGDEVFVKRHLGLALMLMESIINRDSNGNGIADYGVGWSTYDVSEALKRSPDNLYLGVKQLVAYQIAAEMALAHPQIANHPKNADLEVIDEDGKSIDGNGKALFEKAGIDNRYLRNRQADKLMEQAKLIYLTLEKTIKENGYLPVSLEKSFKGWDQYCLVLNESLLYPALTGGTEKPLFEKVAELLKPTFIETVKRNKTTYGYKLSSGEPVTWFSKVMVADVVGRSFFNTSLNGSEYPYKWNKNNNQAYQDGAFSETREWPGNWYPRGMASFGYLWQDSLFSPLKRKEWLQGIAPTLKP